MTEPAERRPGFEAPYPVAVSQVGPTEWELTADLLYRATDQDFLIPAGSTTDFASVPAVLTWCVPVSTGLPAAVLHDALWRVRVPAAELDYRDADGVLRQALGALEPPVPTVRRYLMWAAVRWGSLLARRGGWRGWHKDAPAVLGITLASLPVVGPLAVLNAAGWLVYRLAEALASTLSRKESS